MTIDTSPTRRDLLCPQIALIALIIGAAATIACVKPNPDVIAESSAQGTDDSGQDGTYTLSESGGDTGDTGDDADDGGPPSDDSDGTDESDDTGPRPDIPDGQDPACAGVDFELPAECNECLEQRCCDSASECAADSDCACMVECLASEDDPLVCALGCGLIGPLVDTLMFDELATCNSLECSESCPILEGA